MNRPKSVVCYICGREFGTHSINIHIKSCQQKWENEQNLKPKSQRKPLPQPPQEIKDFKNMKQEEIEKFNAESFDHYNNNSLVPCQNCGRTFSETAFVHHQKACTAENPFRSGNEKNQEQIPCSKCGRSFIKDRVQKHESVCKGSSTSSTQQQKGASQTQPKSQNNLTSPQTSQKSSNSFNSSSMSGTKGGMSSQGNSLNSSPQKFLKPKTLACHLCGREFGTKSLEIHVKSCREKFITTQKNKPKHEQKPLPSEPEGFHEIIKKINLTEEDIEMYNASAMQIYNCGSLSRCGCGRTFTDTAYESHIKSCKQAPSQGMGQQPKMTQRPQLLMCHICGREYGTTSLNIHIPQCEKKWMNEQAKLPPNQRRPLPQPPKQIKEPSKINSQEMSEYNEMAFKQYNSESLMQCEWCMRTFTAEAIKHHNKACTKEKPMKKVQQSVTNVDEISIKPQKQQIEQIAEEQPQSEGSLVKCQQCGRSFLQERIQKHESVCKGKK